MHLALQSNLHRWNKLHGVQWNRWRYPMQQVPFLYCQLSDNKGSDVHFKKQNTPIKTVAAGTCFMHAEKDELVMQKCVPYNNGGVDACFITQVLNLS